MLKNWFQKNKNEEEPALAWDTQAQEALSKSLQSAPLPALLKGKLKKELVNAAEAVTRQAGRTTVTAQDLLSGLLAKLPPAMQEKAKKMVEEKMTEMNKE